MSWTIGQTYYNRTGSSFVLQEIGLDFGDGIELYGFWNGQDQTSLCARDDDYHRGRFGVSKPLDEELEVFDV